MIIPSWKWTNDIEAEILKELEGIRGRVVHICSATSGIGDVRLDRWSSDKYKGERKIWGQPNIKGDMCFLPFKSGIAGAVVCDPPYSPTRQGKYFPRLVEELVRITAPRGKIIFLCPWILQNPCVEPKKIWLRPSGEKKGTFPSYKILSVSIKTNSQLEDIGYEQKEELKPYTCSVCKQIVGFAPVSVIEFMKQGDFLKTYKCNRCKSD